MPPSPVPSRSDRLWVCHACKMIGSDTEAERHVELKGHRVEQLDQETGYAIVDSDDLARLQSHRWALRHDGYVVAYSSRTGGSVSLHREVLGMPGRNFDPREVDHINRDRRDNRKANLRVMSRAENCQNQPAKGGSLYRGVHFDKERNAWRAKVTVGGVRVLDARFATEVEAAIAAETARQQAMPFAVADPRLTHEQES